MGNGQSSSSRRWVKLSSLLLLSVFLVLTLSSCGLGVRTRSLFGGKAVLDVSIADTANNNNPVAVDYVLVYDENLLKELLKMPAKDWFERRQQFKRDYPEDSGFISLEWEWTPGQRVPPQDLPLEARARGAIVFALYYSKGDHRARIEPNQNLKITFLENSFMIEPR